MKPIITVAIDGPGGAGKSTVAKAVAARFGFAYVDTGAIYRALGLAVREKGLDAADESAVAGFLNALSLAVEYNERGEQRLLVNGTDVTGRLRTPEVSALASVVSAQKAVRSFLLETQRALARSRSVVMDGRDIGTVVLPQASVKVFLTASPEVRARRRWLELREKGTPQPYADVLREMNERDARDSGRAISPLRPAEDAVLLDSSEMDVSEVAEAVAKLVEARLRT